MKHRTPKFETVVKKSRTTPRASPIVTPSPPRRATPDRGRIQGWNADDVERQEEEAFHRLPDRDQIQAVITEWVQRFRRANDPEIVDRIAKQAVGRDLTEHSMSHMQIIEGPDPRIVLRPHPKRWAWLKQGLAMQFPASKKVVTDPRHPGRAPWWSFIKDLRKSAK